jgi:hypothetical protein
MYEFKMHAFTWKTTWAWIEETGRKPNGQKEKRITLSVVLDQGRKKRLREQKGHCYANQVMMWIHAN